MVWNTRSQENPSSDEFLKDPDFRQIAAFFLGWAFFYSGQIILTSPLLRENFMRACLSFRSLVTKNIKKQPEPNDIEAPAPPLPATTRRHGQKVPGLNTEVNNSPTTSQLGGHEGNALLVTLALCFTCASVAHFVSLLRYTTAGETACAFVVAWGGTAGQVGRLTGLLILSLELKKLVGRREACIFWTLLFILLGFVFANNALAVGTLRRVPRLGISLCYRRHFTPTGLTSSLALIATESYLMIRFIFFISPKGLGWLNKLDTLGDSRVYRTLSLLSLDVMTITSATKPTNLLVDYVPFAIGVVVVLFAFDLALAKTEKEPIPSWSFYDETRRFTLCPAPAPSMASTLSIRRMSNHTTYTISLPSPDFSDNDPPPAPTRSALSLRVALTNFTAREQQNSRAVLDGHTKAMAESPTLPSPATAQSPRSARSSIRRIFAGRSEHTDTQSIRSSLRKGHRHRPQVSIVINPDEQIPDDPQPTESSAPPDSEIYSPDYLQMPPPRKRGSRTKRSSTSSGLTYLTPISQKNTPSRRPSYLLSPARSYQQSMASTPRTPVPTWEDMYRHQGLQFDPRLEIPPLPSRSGSVNHQSTSPHTPAVPFVPFIARTPVSPPPGLTKFQPITQPSLLANTPPVERSSGIKGPRPLVTASRVRSRALRGGS